MLLTPLPAASPKALADFAVVAWGRVLGEEFERIPPPEEIFLTIQCAVSKGCVGRKGYRRVSALGSEAIRRCLGSILSVTSW